MQATKTAIYATLTVDGDLDKAEIEAIFLKLSEASESLGLKLESLDDIRDVFDRPYNGNPVRMSKAGNRLTFTPLPGEEI